MSRFSREEAIQLKAKFALANLIKRKIHSHHLRVASILFSILNQAIEFEGESAQAYLSRCAKTRPNKFGRII